MATLYEGLTHIDQQQLISARRVLEIAEELTYQWPEQDVEVSHLQCIIFDAMIWITLAEKACNQAWQYAMQINKIASAHPHPLNIGIANQAIASVLAVMEQAPDSNFPQPPDHYFNMAIEAFHAVNAQAETAWTMYKQALYHLRHQQRHQAMHLLYQSITIFNRLGMTHYAALSTQAQYATL